MSSLISPLEGKLAVVSFIALILLNNALIIALDSPYNEAVGIQNNQNVQIQTFTSNDSVTGFNYESGDGITKPQVSSDPVNTTSTVSDDQVVGGVIGFIFGGLDFILTALLGQSLSDKITDFLSIFADAFGQFFGYLNNILGSWSKLIELAGWASALVLVPQLVMLFLVANPIFKLVSAFFGGVV